VLNITHKLACVVSKEFDYYLIGSILLLLLFNCYVVIVTLFLFCELLYDTEMVLVTLLTTPASSL